MPSLHLNPPYRVEHVGSFQRPERLLEAARKVKAGTATAEEFRKIQDEAIVDLVRFEEGLGLGTITDGEYRRRLWSAGFFDAVPGFGLREGALGTFRNEQGQVATVPSPYAKERLKRTRGIATDEFAYLKSVVKKGVPKITIPSPTVMHFFLGPRAVDEAVYPDIEVYFDDLTRIYREEIAALAKLGCTYVQLDDTALPCNCDTTVRGEVKKRGEDPDKLTATYMRLINDAIRDRPKDMVTGIHLCRGNFKDAWMAEGGYEPVAEKLFNEIAIDTYFLEYDTARAGDFNPLRFVPKHKSIVLGLVSTKTRELETKDDTQAAHRRGGEIRAARAALPLAAMRLRQRRRRRPEADHGRHQAQDRADAVGCARGLGLTPAGEPLEMLDLRLPSSKAAIARIQSERKKVALAQAKRAPFYRGKLDGIRADRLDDPEEWAKIPIIDKETLRSIPADDFLAQLCIAKPAEIAEYWRSGGATGVPLFYPRTYVDQEFAYLQLARCWTCAGVEPGDVCHMSFPLGVHPAGQLWARTANLAGVGIIWVGSGTAMPSLNQLELIQNLKPTMWMGMPSYGLHLANLAEAQGIDLAKSSVRKVLVGAEALSKAKREKLERMWGAEVNDLFGMTEIGILGSDSRVHEGFHIQTDQALFEVVDEKTGLPVPEGQEGLMVITPLWLNNATPFLRWSSGDIVTMQRDERASTGRSRCSPSCAMPTAPRASSRSAAST